MMYTLEHVLDSLVYLLEQRQPVLPVYGIL